MSDEVLDLLIVGAGPAGLLASSIASLLGLRHLLIERRANLHVHPSAHVVKTHSMEVYRRIGIADVIHAAATPASYQRFVTWCDSVSGLVYGRNDLRGLKGPAPRFAAISPTYPANIPQNLLEPMLYARACVLAPKDTIRFGEELIDYSEDDTGIVANTVAEGASRAIRCRYLIGADGASSRVRRLAGIDMDGPAVLAHFLAIHIASDVRRFLERDPGVLFFVRAPGLDGTFIMHQPDGSQAFMMRFDPAVTPFETFDIARCTDIVRQGFGCNHPFKVTGVGRWAMSAQVANSYRLRRALLVGDAAHRFPPTGGLGLNTGVEDVENLIWKLAATLRGHAGEELLDTYERECRPIALRNRSQSVDNLLRLSEFTKSIGADAGEDEFRTSLAALKAGDRECRLPAIQTAIDGQLKHFAYLELEMAAAMESGAFLPASRTIARPMPMTESYQPSFEPGGYVPHLWLSPEISTIDRLRFDRFTLFAPNAAVAQWRAASDSLSTAVLPVDVVGLDATMSSGSVTAADFWGDEPYAILVRPDGRIAWVEPEGLTDRAGALARAVESISHPSEAA